MSSFVLTFVCHIVLRKILFNFILSASYFVPIAFCHSLLTVLVTLEGGKPMAEWLGKKQKENVPRGKPRPK
jgi:hypothetical protein